MGLDTRKNKLMNNKSKKKKKNLFLSVLIKSEEILIALYNGRHMFHYVILHTYNDGSF